MALPWLRILDAVIGVTDLARSRKMKSLSRTGGDPESLESLAQRAPLHGLEARLAGVMVAALKEVFDRDNRRLELERSQAEAERERAERALRLELLRQRADREIGRMRLLAAVGVVGWLGTLSFASRMVETSSRVMFAGGWLVLLAAVATSFAAQAQVAAAVERAKGAADGMSDDRDAVWSSAPGSISLSLVVVGLALVGLAILL
jgi:hypothetical protein